LRLNGSLDTRTWEVGMSATTTERPQRPAGRSTTLRREVGLIGLMWASVGSIIGSGWLFGAQEGLTAAGPAAIISWVIGGVAILFLALVHAELGGMYPVSGGTARFPHYAFGGAAGASFGWFSWLQAATVAPIEVLAMIQYGQHYDFAKGWLEIQNKVPVLTTSGLIVAIVLMGVMTVVNFLGVKWLANINSTLTWWKIAVPLITIIVLLSTQFDSANFTAGDGFNPGGSHGILEAVAVSGIIFSYLGFEQADQLAGESKNPKRDIPIAIIGSIVIGMVVYILLQIAFLGALPNDKIGESWATGDYTTFTGPFAQVASLAGIAWLAKLVYADAIISPAGTGLIYTTGSSRVSYGLARNGYFPSAFAWTGGRGVPWVGLITAFVAGCICFLPFPSWQSLVGLITSASVLMYAGAPLALGVFRRRLPDADRPYRLPAAWLLCPFSFIVANFIIMWTTWTTVWKLGIAILIGYAILILTRVFKLNDRAPHMRMQSAYWLPVYLVGMGVISYFSTYGGTGDLKLWWDMVVVAIFSLGIYYWAMAVGLPSAEITEMIEEVVTPEEEGLDLPAH
jgi:amino acid transporter